MHCSTLDQQVLDHTFCIDIAAKECTPNAAFGAEGVSRVQLGRVARRRLVGDEEDDGESVQG
ncbi:MAG: hypothetical protein Aurels2KO_42710 [Aureliella sp.]